MYTLSVSLMEVVLCMVMVGVPNYFSSLLPLICPSFFLATAQQKNTGLQWALCRRSRVDIALRLALVVIVIKPMHTHWYIELCTSVLLPAVVQWNVSRNLTQGSHSGKKIMARCNGDDRHFWEKFFYFHLSFPILLLLSCWFLFLFLLISLVISHSHSDWLQCLAHRKHLPADTNIRIVVKSITENGGYCFCIGYSKWCRTSINLLPDKRLLHSGILSVGLDII